MEKFSFFFNSILLGAGLSMDAFSLSVVNGMNEPGMKIKKSVGIAAIFGFFQAFMPVTGWLCICKALQYFVEIEKFTAVIALILLIFIGGKMLFDSFYHRGCADGGCAVGAAALLVQGIATSVDALSVGFVMADYNWIRALSTSLIIAAVTFLLCFWGVFVGKRLGAALLDKASALGGAILIFIGFKIFFTS